MTVNTRDELLFDHNHDGINRRGFLKCMAWVGTGTLCVLQGGVLKSFSLSDARSRASMPREAQLRPNQ
jgi:3',5'-cyclic-AMP phosphodiesterase